MYSKRFLFILESLIIYLVSTMFRLRLRGNINSVMNALSTVGRPVEVEVYVLVNDQDELFSVIQACVAHGIAIEIVPGKNEQPAGVTTQGQYWQASRPSTEPTSMQGDSSIVSWNEDSSMLKKYKEKKKVRQNGGDVNGGVTKAEKEEVTTTQSIATNKPEVVPREKKEEPVSRKDEKKEEKTAKPEPEKQESKKQDEKSKKNVKEDFMERLIAEQLQVANEEEPDFKEWVEARDEAFSRTEVD